jgi:hypothetical protein
VKQILVGIQDLLDQPNPADPAQTDGYQLFVQVFDLYISIVSFDLIGFVLNFYLKQHGRVFAGPD